MPNEVSLEALSVARKSVELEDLNLFYRDTRNLGASYSLPPRAVWARGDVAGILLVATRIGTELLPRTNEAMG